MVANCHPKPKNIKVLNKQAIIQKATCLQTSILVSTRGTDKMFRSGQWHWYLGISRLTEWGPGNWSLKSLALFFTLSTLLVTSWETLPLLASWGDCPRQPLPPDQHFTNLHFVPVSFPVNSTLDSRLLTSILPLSPWSWYLDFGFSFCVLLHS